VFQVTGRYALLITCAITGFVSYADEVAVPHSTVVITSDQFPLSGVTVPHQLFNLDAVDRIEQRLGKNLPADEDKALALMKQRIAGVGQSQLNKELREAYQALILSMQYGLDRYPAVIFDQQVIVYGVTDLYAATKRYRHWLKETQEVVADD
jgi:integrating conjugative element protein (TIGR03757 family)